MLTARLVEESERRAAEAARLKEELIRARTAEKEAKEKLLDFLSRTAYQQPVIHVQTPVIQQPLSPPPQTGGAYALADIPSPPPDLTSYELLAHADVDQLSLEIEKERVEYLEKSKHLQNQLRELRSEIEVLKVGEKQTELDHIHDEQVRLGETKYSTLRRVKSGSTKSRVAFFEEL